MPESVIAPSASVNGVPILITATSLDSVGTMLHATHATILEEVYVWVANNHTGAVDFTLQIGGTAIIKTVSLLPKQGDRCIQAGLRLKGTTLYGVASVSNVLVASLNINRTS